MIYIIELNWVQCKINVQPFLSKQIFSLKFLKKYMEMAHESESK